MFNLAKKHQQQESGYVGKNYIDECFEKQSIMHRNGHGHVYLLFFSSGFFGEIN
jgi:hypothetical protein